MEIIYHCSPTDIDTFIFDNGVHMGGINSALEAGLRKLNRINIKNLDDLDKVFLYTFKLNTNAKIYESRDVGESWTKVIQYARNNGYSLIKYTNIYEPDYVPSYIILNSSLVSIVKKIKIDYQEACDILDQSGLI